MVAVQKTKPLLLLTKVDVHVFHASTVIRPTTLRTVFKRKTEIKNNRKVVV